MSRLEGFSTQVSGVTRFGKSYWAKKTLIPLLAEYKPVIIFDYKGEYIHGSGAAGSEDADPSWQSYSSIFDFFKSVREAGEISQEVHVVRSRDDQDYNNGLAYLEHKKTEISIVLDEAQFIFDDSGTQVAANKVKKLVRAGAGDGTDVIFIAQRVMDIHPDIRSQFTRRITFRQNHQSDIDVMAKDNGFSQAEKARDLDKREYLVLGRFPEHLEGDLAQNAEN